MAIYSDLNSISTTNKPLLQNIESVYQSLNNLFNIEPGQVLFAPTVGVSLPDVLFEFIDDFTSLEVYRIIVEAIQNFEKRVTIINSLTTITPIPDENKYDITLVFQIIGIEGQNFEFTGSLQAS